MCKGGTFMPITRWFHGVHMKPCLKRLTVASAAVLAMFGIAARAAPAKEPEMVLTPSAKPTSAENSNTSASQADEFHSFSTRCGRRPTLPACHARRLTLR